MTHKPSETVRTKCSNASPYMGHLFCKPLQLMIPTQVMIYQILQMLPGRCVMEQAVLVPWYAVMCENRMTSQLGSKW